MKAHKNKTLATLLGLLLGGFGVHRFYLRGPVDRIGLAHLCTVPMCGLIYGLMPEKDWFFKILPLLLSYIVGFIETFVIGLSSMPGMAATTIRAGRWRCCWWR